MAARNTGGGVFTPEELINWLRGVKPTPRNDIAPMPKLGTLAMELRKREALEEEEEAERLRRGQQEEEEREEDEQDYEQDYEYKPNYNFTPDDASKFDDVDGYDPGNLPNPNAQPGDYDYSVNQSADVYNDFSFEADTNPDLPIHRYRREILDTIASGQVTVIQGSTGSGKSTQVPQFILEEFAANREHCNIICTQPRRIAAKSVARYVAEMHDWPLGSLVGYQIGMDKNVSESTRLTFVTTGVLLEKLVNQRNMNQYTHVILDEVHERDKDTDFCLLVVRKLLHTNSQHVKVVLMSATFEAEYFARYFSTHLAGSIEIPPIIKVEGSPHQVHEFFIEDIRDLGDCEAMDPDYPRVNDSCYEMVDKLLRRFDAIERRDPMYGKGEFVRGTVLVFLPGLPEIMQLKDMLSQELQLTKLVLHSTISWEDQFKVFLPPEPGRRKVILATNIAESSITVPDIKFVIDFCLVKQMMCDWNTKYCCLETVWASRASLEQRKGRAGRVSSGRCYRLISREFYQMYIPAYSKPEMQRCPIESIVLKCKKLNIGEPRKILNLALQAPDPSDVEMAITTLKEVGALTTTIDGITNKFDGKLTFVGRILECLPIDVRLGKLLILGHAFGCLESCLVIAASLSLRSFFKMSPLDELTGYRSKRGWDKSNSSDCLAILNAYKAWSDMKHKHRYSRERNWETQWCRRNFLNKKTLNDVADLVKELTRRLAGFNIRPTRALNSHYEEEEIVEELLLKVVISGAFYPNYFLWGELDEEMCSKDMSGHDAATTVKVNGLPSNPLLYTEQLCALMGVCGKGKRIHFEFSKAFIEFDRPTARPMTSSPAVMESVYCALWLRNKRNRFYLYLEDPRDSQDRQARKAAALAAPAVEAVIPPPKLCDDGTWQILVTHVVDGGRFWAQHSDLNSRRRIRDLMESITSRELRPLIMEHSKMPGTYCLARYSGDGLFYRAKILEVRTERRASAAEVFFVDYGNIELVPLDRLCAITGADMQEPAKAFECHLTGVKPPPPYEHFSPEAGARLDQLVFNKQLMAKIYSKVDGVLRVELYDTNIAADYLINEALIQEGFAVRCEEPYQSRVAHAQTNTRHQSETANFSFLRSAMDMGSGADRNYAPGYRTELGGASCTTVDWCHENPKPPMHGGRRVPLKGPSSSYEVTFQSMTLTGRHHSVKIHQDSLNNIVLNLNPQDKHQRMMVAQHIVLNPTKTACVARESTLLSAIPGLAHIVCLIFAPTVEMRCDELKRQYVGALCGLGYDLKSSASLYPEHDMEITFDTLLTTDHLNQINQIRTAINLTLESSDNLAEWGELAVKKIQKNVRKIVTNLILALKTPVPPYTSSTITEGSWNQIPADSIVYVEPSEDGKGDEDGEDNAHFYPMINGIKITGERIDLMPPTKILLMRKHFKDLRHKIANNQFEPGRVKCELCRVHCISMLEMRDHMTTEQHIIKEKRLFTDTPIEGDVQALAIR